MRPRASILRAILAGFVALGILSAHTTAQSPACDAEIATADVIGAELHYAECGNGDTLVFVHGGFGDLRTFRAQIETFAKEFRVIAYSRRFHPPNDPPRDGELYSLERHAADLAALLKALEAAPAHLVASSYGARIALALALEQPELVRSLVLGEPPVPHLLSRTSVGRAVHESFNTRALRPYRNAFASGDAEEGVRRFFDGISGELGTFDQLPEPARAEFMKKAAEFRLEMLTDRSTYLPLLDCEALGRLERPVLLVTGEQSPEFFLLGTAELKHHSQVHRSQFPAISRKVQERESHGGQ